MSDFCIHSFNIFSDHAPLTFTTISKNRHALSDQYSYQHEFIKWDARQSDIFRRGIISDLPLFNTLVTQIDRNNPNCTKELISGFTDIVRKTADPLFKKELLINESRDL